MIFIVGVKEEWEEVWKRVKKNIIFDMINRIKLYWGFNCMILVWCFLNVDLCRILCYYMNMVYRINMRFKLRSVVFFWNECMYIIFFMVVVKVLSEFEIGYGFGFIKW